MRIDGPNRNSGVSGKGGARRGSGSSAQFHVSTDVTTQKSVSTGSLGPVTGIDAILALQGVDDPLLAKRKAVKRGQSLIETLEEMKAELLAGRMKPEKLDRLVTLLSEARTRSEPGLDAVIDDIELRARVELAKFGRFPAFS